MEEIIIRINNIEKDIQILKNKIKNPLFNFTDKIKTPEIEMIQLRNNMNNDNDINNKYSYTDNIV